jgi:hypothetical protein
MAREIDETALSGAQARFALFMASLFERAGLTPMAEFASLLDAFAETVTETDPAEGALLAEWAGAIAATARH